MKKTEKIEIRLSHEDKERLSRMAENEGRTISQLVRGLIDKYLELSPTNIRRPVPKKTLFLSSLVSGIIGFVLSYGLVKGNNPEYNTTETRIVKNVRISYDNAWSVLAVPLLDKYEIEHSVQYGTEAELSIKIALHKNAYGQYPANFVFCLRQTDQCEEMAKAELILDPQTKTEINLLSKDNHNISIAARPHDTKY